MNTTQKETTFTKYSISWYKAEKVKFFNGIDRFPQESPMITLPFINNEEMYPITHEGRDYLCNERVISPLKLLYSSNEVSGMPENVLYTQNDLILGILLQEDIQKYGNPYESHFYFMNIFDKFFKTIDMDTEFWFETMFRVVNFKYGQRAGAVFYSNYSLFINKPKKTSDELLDEGAEFFRKKSEAARD